MKRKRYKKLNRRHFRCYKTFRSTSPTLRRWRKQLVTIHPCADETEILRKIGVLPEECQSVDGYFLYKHFFIWFGVYGLNYPKDQQCNARYFTSTQNHRSDFYNHHHFLFDVGVPMITTDVIAKVLLFLERWIEGNEKLMQTKPITKNGRFGEVSIIFDGDVLTVNLEKDT